MRIRLLFTVVLPLFWALGAEGTTAPASNLLLTTPYEVNGALLQIPSAVTSEGQTLALTGYGIRKKTIVLVKVSVYVASHYISAPKDWNPADPMASLKKQAGRALNLSFMRDVSGSKVRGAFMDSLKANGLDPNRKDLSQVLDAMAIDLVSGNQIGLTALVQPGKSEQTITVTTPKGTAQVKSASVADDIWSMWFGKSDDGGLEDLKAQLVGGQKQ